MNNIFDVVYGVNLDYNKMEVDKKGIAFVSRTSKNNGIVGYVRKIKGIKANPENTISVSCGGSVLEAFYHQYAYYSGRDLFYLEPKIKLAQKEMLIYCTLINSNKYRYSYGRQANKTLKQLKILHPDEVKRMALKYNVPKKPNNQSLHNKQVSLNDSHWKWFKLKDYFEIKGTKSFTKNDIKEYGKGQYPYIITSSVNNAVDGFYNHFTEKGNIITIDSATIGSCFYQALEFSASDHVEKLVPKFHMNSYLAMFLTTLLNQEKYRYSYGRKFSQMRIKATKIKLPVDNNGNPDWQFMQYYIKSLPYSSHLKDKEKPLKNKLAESL